MILACWRIVKTEYGKELPVHDDLVRLGLEAFLPVEIRFYERDRGKRPYSKIALIPATVFVLAELSELEFDIPRLRYVIGIERDNEGFPEVVPFEEMAMFRETHAQWLAEAKTRLAGGKSAIGRGKRAKWRNAREALAELKLDMERKDAA